MINNNDNNESQIQQLQGLNSVREELNSLFDEMNEERERDYKPYWEAKGAYEILSHDIKRTERYDRQWEEFLLSCPYWSSWRENLASFRKVSDLKYYCLRVSEIIQYKDKVSDYGSKRDKETFEKVDKFAWRLMKMNREEFHKEFGGYFDKKTENYMINSDGTFFNSLFSDNANHNDSDSPSCFITELEDEEEIVQDNNNCPNDELLPENKNDKKRRSESEKSISNGTTWKGKISSGIKSLIGRKKNKNVDEAKPYEKEYKLALWKKANWKDKDYRDNHETREGLEKWIKELEIRQSINRWDFYMVDKKHPALIHQSALNKNHEIIEPNKVYYKEKDLSAEGWVRIEKEKGQFQRSNQVVSYKNSHSTTKSDNFSKSLVFGVLGLVALTFGVIIYKVSSKR